MTYGVVTDDDMRSAIVKSPFPNNPSNTIYMVMFNGNLTYCKWNGFSQCNGDVDGFCGWHSK